MTDESKCEIRREEIEEARERIEMAMDHVKHREWAAMEIDLQHAHAALGGEKDDLYEGFDEWDKHDR